jgi:hypothetical protein
MPSTWSKTLSLVLSGMLMQNSARFEVLSSPGAITISDVVKVRASQKCKEQVRHERKAYGLPMRCSTTWHACG